MATAKLYGSRISPFVEKVARGLMIKGIDFETVPVKRPSDLKTWNPTTRKMPVLEIATESIFDSTFILRRLDEIHPEPPLIHAEPLIAAAQRQLEDWSDESLYWQVMALRWLPANISASLDEVLADAPFYLRPIARVMVRRAVVPAVDAQGFGRLPEPVLVREMGLRLDDLITQLDDQSYFFSSSPSVADLAIYGQLSVLNRKPTPQGQTMLAERPALTDFLARVESASATDLEDSADQQ